jgi:hypothetical protein
MNFISPSSSTNQEPLTTKHRNSYRDEAAFRFTLRLRTKRGEPRVVVRVFESGSPNVLTPVVMIGSLAIFPREFLHVESGPEGWGSEDEAKLAVVQLLSLTPGDKGVPTGFHVAFTPIQRAFLQEHAQGLKRIASARWES